MDFYGILFDMKNGSKVPYSKNFFDTLFAAKLEELGVKTITGVLPLTFTTSKTALRSWTIHGNNTQHNYSAEGTLPLTFTTHTAGAANDWTIYGNAEGVGERTANMFNKNAPYTLNKYLNTSGVEVSGSTWGISEYIPIEGDTTYTAYNLSGGGASACWYDENKNFIGGEAYSGATSKSFALPANAKYIRLTLRLINPSNVDTLMLIEGTTPPVKYIPFGYQVPIAVSQTGQTDKTVDIYIGDSPLTEGETVSKQSTGVDIELFEGENTISTTLNNKPETSITYTDYVGVGEYVNGQWQIPLAVTCDRNLLNIYGNMAHSGGVHTIDFNVETSSVTGEMPANSFYQLGIQNAIVKGDETFVISFDKTTAGTAELRMTKGTGSSAEVIETFDISAIKSYQVVFDCEESFGNVYPRLVATEAATQTFEHLMIKKASDKGGFVPYGARYEYNVPIDAPLTAGQSVSDTQTIEVFEGENTIDTTLFNKPTMEIKYK